MDDSAKFKAMDEWRDAYVKALVEALHPSGDVLEIGFDSGVAAAYIQTFHPKSHTIIEEDAKIVEQAKEWACKHSGVIVVKNSWQMSMDKLGAFDSILLYDYENEVALMRKLCPAVVDFASNQAKEVLHTLEEQLSHLKVRYSDHDIEQFYQNLGQHHMQELPQFFQKLRKSKYISEKQYNDAVAKYSLGEPLAKEKESLTEVIPQQPDKIGSFLDMCFKSHMRKGCRFTCFLNDTVSKYEDPQFFKRVISNPQFKYEEKLVPIKVTGASECDLPNEALVMVIEKLV